VARIIDGVIATSSTCGKKTWLFIPAKLRIAMYFDRETVDMLRTTLDRAWASVPPSQRSGMSRSVLAERILKAATKGKRDPDRLRARALMNDCRAMKAAS
jgi:hypothetical protein